MGTSRLEEEYGLFRLVSITEAYLDAISLQVVTGDFDLSIPRQTLVLDEWEVSSTSSWPKREEVFKNYVGFKLRDCSSYKEIQAAIAVRNSIAHGLGRLTSRQRTSMTLATEVARIDVSVGGGQMHLSDTTFNLVEDSCVSFIRDVDGRVPALVKNYP